ncbi:cilia- and flagella-associated protein 251-like [Jatropha curcas]|uniref:cilia- and flagella-associated protein 251-like n=1 Tax=Jatropha curcas TaxID=180498 RepID=UPI0018931C5B|nr:cilia- and flagella-associated protein 251-like [Jatropha curcas]
MAESSSNSSSDSLTEQELQLLKKLSKKYEQKESKEKKAEEKTKKRKVETGTSQKQGDDKELNQNQRCFRVSDLQERKTFVKKDNEKNNPKKLPYGMILMPVFEFLNVDLDKHVGQSVSKLDSGSLKMKDEEADKEELKEEEAEKEKEHEEQEKGKEAEEGNDAETEKIEISDEKTTEGKAEQESESLSAQRSRDAMLKRLEEDLVAEHNRELDEAIQQCKTVIEQNQSLIEVLERIKRCKCEEVSYSKGERNTLRSPSSEKPKKCEAYCWQAQNTWKKASTTSIFKKDRKFL